MTRTAPFRRLIDVSWMELAKPITGFGFSSSSEPVEGRTRKSGLSDAPGAVSRLGKSTDEIDAWTQTL